MFGPAKKRSEPPKPKPVKLSYLKASALHYLSSRAASREMLRCVLERRSKRRLQVKSLDPEIPAMIETVLDELVELDLLDDSRFAEGRRRTLERRGFSKRRIELGLKQKGLDAGTIRGALAEEVDEAAQARRFAERRRLGPWRRSGIGEDRFKKDLSALMRAGFSFTVAKAALIEPESD
jgi:regulatory protein